MKGITTSQMKGDRNFSESLMVRLAAPETDRWNVMTNWKLDIPCVSNSGVFSPKTSTNHHQTYCMYICLYTCNMYTMYIPKGVYVLPQSLVACTTRPLLLARMSHTNQLITADCWEVQMRCSCTSNAAIRYLYTQNAYNGSWQERRASSHLPLLCTRVLQIWLTIMQNNGIGKP